MPREVIRTADSIQTGILDKIVSGKDSRSKWLCRKVVIRDARNVNVVDMARWEGEKILQHRPHWVNCLRGRAGYLQGIRNVRNIPSKRNNRNGLINNVSLEFQIHRQIHWMNVAFDFHHVADCCAEDLWKRDATES